LAAQIGFIFELDKIFLGKSTPKIFFRSVVGILNSWSETQNFSFLIGRKHLSKIYDAPDWLEEK